MTVVRIEGLDTDVCNGDTASGTSRMTTPVACWHPQPMVPALRRNPSVCHPQSLGAMLKLAEEVLHTPWADRRPGQTSVPDRARIENQANRNRIYLLGRIGCRHHLQSAQL